MKKKRDEIKKSSNQVEIQAGAPVEVDEVPIFFLN